MPRTGGPATAKRRGTAFEQEVRRALQAGGWFVIRSAGSHTPVDLVCWPPPWSPDRRVWLVQVKRHGRLRPAETDALTAWAASTGSRAVWVREATAGLRWQWQVWGNAGWQPVDGLELAHLQVPVAPLGRR